MGMMFTKKGEYKSAIQSFDRSIVASNKTGYLPSLGISYLSKAFVYTRLNDLMLAEAYSEKALEICHKTNDMLSIADIYKIKGIIQRILKHYDAAENYFLTSLRINKELSNELNYAESAHELGVLYQQMDKLKESKANFTAALSYYKKIKAQKEIEELQQKIKAL